MRTSLYIVSVIAVLTSGIPSGADTGGTTATFLELGVGGRASGMGEAYTGLAEGASAIYWNPAGTAFMYAPEASFTHAEWITDVRYEYFAFAWPLSWGTLGGDFTFLNAGDMELRTYDPDNPPTSDPDGTFGATFMAADVLYAKDVGRHFSFGGTAKFVRQKIYTDSATGFAADVGAYLKLFSGFSVGFAAKNLGPGMTFISKSYPLPKSISGGAAYRMWHGRVVVASDVLKPLSDDLEVKVGCEVNPHRVISGRIGYATGADTTGLSGLTGGFGFNIGSFSFDMAYAPYKELGNTYRFGITYSFGKEARRITEEVEERMREEFERQKKEMLRVLTVKAEAAMERGDYREAVDTYDVILVWDPADEEAADGMREAQDSLNEQMVSEHVANGARFMEEEKYPEAVLEYTLAVEIDPTNAEALVGMTEAEEKLAELEAKRAAEIKALHDEALEAYKRGDFETAVGKWNAVLTIDPENVEAQNYLADAEERIAQVIDGYAENARAAESAGNWTGAVAYWNRVLKLDPENEEARAGKSRASGKIQSEVKALNDAGTGLYNKGKYDAAEAKFLQALNLDPGNGTATGYLSKIAEKRKKPKEEKKVNYHSIYMKGIEAYTNNQYRTAIAYWEQIPADNELYSKAQTNIRRAKSVLKELEG
ncbi:MAG: PorV/PorQ family protein [Candidatus Coatesbacteria bacterium]|nr:MAG: PorV/PorQ family protein [Candidatus Coatesbacteria bacterium]